jgi:hypothetical protein
MSQQTDSRNSGTAQKMFVIMNIGTVPASDSELGFPNLFHQRILLGLKYTKRIYRFRNDIGK